MQTCALPSCAGVADRAVEEGAFDALVVALRHADRQVLAFLVDQAERGIAARRVGQVPAAYAREHLPDPVRQAGFHLAAGRAVLEVLGGVGMGYRHVSVEQPLAVARVRSEKPTSALQSLMRIS